MFCFNKKKKEAKLTTAERITKEEEKKRVSVAKESPAEETTVEAVNPEPRVSKRASRKSKVKSATYEDFTALLDEFWQENIKLSPSGATMMGYHEYDDRMDEETVEYYEEAKQIHQSFLDRLLTAFPPSNTDRFNGWTLDGKTTFLVLEDTLRGFIKMVDLEGYLIRVSTLSSPHTDLPQILEKNKFETIEDLEKFKARLEDVPRWVDNICKLLEIGLEKNITQSRVVLESIPTQVTALLSAESDPFTTLAKEKFKLVKDSPESLKEEILAVISDKVLVSFKEYGDFLNEYYPKLSEEPSMPKRMSNGEDLYKFLLEYHTTTKLSPQEVHDIGLKEVERITDTMREIAESEGFSGETAIDDYQDHIDEICVVKTEEELLAHYRAVAMDISPRLPELFGLLPRTTFGIRPIPAYAAEHAPGAYYLPPPEDLSQPGWFCLNTSFLPTRKTYVAEALVAHEAIPGHHMQIALATENDNLHAFRKFTYQTAYVEGWGLYSECLGFELGLYKTNSSHYGRLQAEILRACRLVVDTGMNYFGWTKQQAMDFMLKHKAGTFEDCDSESSRYLGLPGQACAYKIGEIKIRELRKLAEDSLGKDFKIRAFHDLILAVGSVPLTVLEQIVRDWISDLQHK